MKVLQLGKYDPSFFNGGMEKAMGVYSEKLSKKDFTLDILCFNKFGKTRIRKFKHYKIYSCSILFKLLSSPFSFSYLFFIKKLWHNYDLINIHLPNPFIVIFLNFFLPKNAKYTIHYMADVSDMKFFFLYKPFEKYLLKRAQLIITHTNNLAKSKVLKPYRKKVCVHYLGLRDQDWLVPKKNEIRQNLTSQIKKYKYFIFVGRFTEYKNLGSLVEAFKRIKNLDDELRLILIGKGELYNDLLNLVIKNKLEKKVLFYNDVNDKEKRFLIKNAISLVLPSVDKREAYGYVQLEAMALSCPVISFKIKESGVGELNHNDITGFSLNVSKNEITNINNLSKALRKTLDKNTRLKLGKKGFQRAKFLSLEYGHENFKNILTNTIKQKQIGI